MGAGASAAGMPMEERRALFEVMKDKYSRSDLDELAEDDKQAWLEVVVEQEEAAATQLAKTTRLSNGMASAVVHEAVEAAAAAHVASLASAKTGESDSGSSKGGGIRPQGRTTRMSYHLAANEDWAGVATAAGHASKTGGAPGGETPGKGSDAGVKTRRMSAELPAWKRTALAVEKPNELSVGDIVRARDTTFNGMWFEGVLTTIHDEATFTVELTGGDDGVDLDCITVGIDDLVRVMPWYCIEVGDIVECQLENSAVWVGGTVVRILHSKGIYDVVLSSTPEDGGGCTTDGEGGGDGEMGKGGDNLGREEKAQVECQVTENRIRKISSGRQSVARRWKKAYLASCAISSMGKLAMGSLDAFKSKEGKKQ